MSFPTTTIEHRVGALGRRVTRVEEDVAGFGDTIYAVRRAQIEQGLLLAAIADHLQVRRPTKDEVEAVLDAE